MKKIVLNVNEGNRIGQVPNKFFGHFLEYMHDCIDPGLWAQLLKARSFENINSLSEVTFFPWEKFGMNIICELDKDRTYAPMYSVHIVNNVDDEAGIKQRDIWINKGEQYRGYVWAYCDKKVNLFIKVYNDNIIYKNSFDLLPGRWQKVEFDFYNDYTSAAVSLCFYTTEMSEIWLDQASLMPKCARDGIWNDVLFKVKELSPAVMRFPGGCVADCYFWEDGIGVRDLRPCTVNKHWGGIENNNFGTDEYVKLCRETGAEPLICVNFGSSTPQDAANWVEYCNGDDTTKYGKMRADNGHKEPYSIKYWEIGNEAFGNWEIGHCSAEEYIKKYLLFAKEMRKKDPEIFLLACGGDGGSLEQSWNETVLSGGKGYIDALSMHFYAPLVETLKVDDNQMYYSVVSASEKINRVIKLTRDSMEKTRLKVPIAVTEWNCNYGDMDNSDREQSLESAISNSCSINMFLRNINVLNMCIISDLINGWAGGIIRSNNGKALKTLSYELLKLYLEAEIEWILESKYECDKFETFKTGNLEAMKNIQYVDILSCLNKGGELVVFAVNRSLNESYLLEMPNKKIKFFEYIWADDIYTKNIMDNEHNIERVRVAGSGDRISLLPHSIYKINFV